MSHDGPRVSRLSIGMALAGIMLLAIPASLHLVLVFGRSDTREGSDC